jgi:ABC-type multidrug transport system fused ATPase/permease subunit
MYDVNLLLKEFILKHKLLLVGYIIVLIITPIRDIGIPHLVGKILESLRKSKISYHYIYIFMGILFIIQIGNTINDFIEIKTFPVFQKFISQKILNYIFDQSSTNLQDIMNGKILGILAHSPRTLYNYMDVFKSCVIPQIVAFVIAVIYIGLKNKYLGILTFGIIVIYYYLSFKTLNNCDKPSEKREEYLIKVNEQIDDVLSNVVGILNAGEKERELSYLNTFYDWYQKLGESTMRCSIKYKFILMPILLISLFAFIIIGYTSVSNNKMQIENFIVCIIIYLYVFNSIIKTYDDFRDTAIRSGMIKEHLKLFESMPDSDPNLSKVQTIFKDKYIYFDNVNFSYNEKKILNNFTLDIKKGEKLLIIGQIGSGKTTILKLLLRYKTPESGHVYYMGLPFEDIPRKELRKKIGYIPQAPVLLNRTLYENIVYGTPNFSKDKVYEMIQNLQLDNIFNKDRLDENVGKHGSKLSGGQRQVVWILRVLVQNPEILVMDEPTSAIDKDTKTFINRLFQLVMKNRTVIIVSHDEYMSTIVDRTIKMNNGSFVPY